MFYIQVAFYKAIMQVLKLAGKLIPQTQPFIFTGKDAALALTKLIIEQDKQHVFIVTDAVLNKLGIANKICEQLALHNVNVTVFDQVTPDPSESVVNDGIALLKAQQCDLVLAIGGGSSIDAAKMMAVLAHSGQTIKGVAGLLKIKKFGLPLCVIPTTSGTGSEVTMAAVITDTDSQSKSLIVSPKMLAMATALDPLMMSGMPAKITADTGFDALTHAIEAYLSTYANAQTDQFSLIAIKLIFKQLPQCYHHGDDLDARQALALASCYAGLAFNKTNVGYVHAISHQIGAKYHSPHGFTNAVVLPFILEFYCQGCEQRLAEMAAAIGINTSLLSADEAAKQFIRAVKTLQKEVAIPTKLACINQQDITELSKSALQEAHYFYPVPKYLTRQQCETILHSLCSD
jgi:alcohol dehydrogenase